MFKPILLFFLIFAPLSCAANAKDGVGAPSVYAITIDSGITPHVAEYVLSALDEAAQKRATALLIYLDTPGGLLDSTRLIVQAILKSAVPVIVYVAPAGARAGSAGLFIALSANVLAMAPSSNIGAAHPVGMMGADVAGEMNKKVTNDAAAWARSIAEMRGKNPSWAEKAVKESQAVSAEEALKLGVIDVIASSDEDLLKKLNKKEITIAGRKEELRLTDAKIVSLPMNARQKIMKFLADPNLIYILMLLGVLGIFIEFQAPGLILPGLLGLLCLAVVFGVQILPINWFGAVLIFLALACFIAEIFITSLGILGIAGITLLIMGSYLLFSVPGSSLFVEPLIIFILSGILAFIMLIIGVLLVRAKRQGPTANVDALVGSIGEVEKSIEPPDMGLIMLHGSFWRARAEETILKGAQVRVVKVLGTILVVEKV